MKIDAEKIYRSVTAAYSAYLVVRELAETVADALAADGQPELQTLLMQMREKNDEDRARREAKLIDAAAKE